MNPNGSSIAFISKQDVKIYSFQEIDKAMFSIAGSKKNLPKAITYSANARRFVVGYANGHLVVYDGQKYQPMDTIFGKTPAKLLAISPNDYFVAALCGKTVDIWNFETKTLRTQLTPDAEPNGAAFSTDASMLALTLPDKVLIYNTRTWELIQKIATNAHTNTPSFNYDDKYLAFVQDSSEIVIYNVRRQTIEQHIPEPSKIGGSRFISNAVKSNIISSRVKNASKSKSDAIVFWDAGALAPYYGKRLNEEVEMKMNDWIKMMDGESLEDYQIRVNDSTRIKQMEVYRQEVATGLAGNRLLLENPFPGDYEDGEGLLTINFNTIPPIAIPVPAGELGDFNNPGKLKFGNEVYILNDKDEFQLVYVEVTNEVNDKVYIFDQIGRTKLTAIETDLNFVPLEVLQQALEEEAKLQAMMEEVVKADKQDRLITENTQINVDAHVVSDFDADGNKILNYQVNYRYEVINKEFSTKEDFPPGAYDIEKSNAAMSLMKIIKQSFEDGDFAKYLTDGKRVNVTITGTADGAPINRAIAYNGRYGDFFDEPYYENDELKAMTVNSSTKIATNPQLAFIRAASVQNYLEENVSTLQYTRNEYTYKVEVSEERGGDFRKILIQFFIIDAFKQK
ncbi:MAG: WD40 repeat domain-containing protein [Dysgonamonadaceae bacterium]|nr:WD40 repeat domain-containing protein [Dysgonamonadaceae bacterium]